MNQNILKKGKYVFELLQISYKGQNDMKILMIVTWYGDNKNDKVSGNFHTDMAKALSKHNDVAIYFPFDNTIKTSISYEYEDDILVFRGKKSNGIFDKLKKTKSDFEIIKKVFSPDIIHAQVCLGAGEIALYIRLLYGVPYLITEHAPIEVMDLCFKRKLKYKIITKLSKKNVAVSPNLRDRLNNLMGKDRFMYICNGVNDPLSIVKNEKIYINKVYINCSIVAALYSKDIKGLQFLLPAIQRIVNEGIKIRLHICGGGTYLDYYKRMAVCLGIIDNIIFYGMCDKYKVYSIIGACDFNISASLFESAGVAVEEACLLGKPQVITNSGGANSLIPDSFAVKTDRSSVDELYLGIKKMLTKFNNYDNDVIRSYGISEFLMEDSCKKYECLYKLSLKQ